MDFQRFLEDYKQKLFTIFSQKKDAEEQTLVRGIEETTLKEIMDLSPLSSFIPSKYGGYGGNTAEALAMLEASSYESLPLSLMMGINGALFLQPIANYANEETKKNIFNRVINANKLGGLMITEPDYGSDALKMQTSYRKVGDDTYKIEGTKHWGGLTGMADYWLITARGMNDKGDLGRDISFFIHDTRNGGIEVEEYYNNLGLYMLPYGKNNIDITVDESHKLQPKSTGVTMMLDLLHRSRLQFPGMGMGFLRRMMDEAVTHCKERFVGGQSLINYDQVKSRLSTIQAYFTVCSAMCNFTSTNVPLEKNTSRMDLEANAIKSIITDFMQHASQSLLQLTGAMGYRLDHIAGRSVVDSRPFQIFEGSNDILYQQISESVLKMMRKLKNNNLQDFLSDFHLTERSSEYFKEHLNFELDAQMPQRKLVDLGKAIGRIISMEFTLNLGDRGFNEELIQNAIKTLQEEVYAILQTYKHGGKADVVEDYQLDSSWFKLSTVNA
ncbi:MAG: acyl-CoA/acyl-ACP dehydrogenase [Gracilimonas sp.]|uniref:acyl-CoA dehydrogenase family protein n=1 Tax=Gracilimonas sp. TaxID=1974203 RepID=UPI0019CB106A|nr:acyl-CoA dehydrogenase family protein [Gracilimonas sp.]MBD3614939.1 acyl-CoA/acyl-ACP dehydrogenase [Gracilimonas sp.]